MNLKTSGVVETKAELRRIADFLESKKPMEKCVKAVKEEKVLKLTAAGKDYRGRKFEPYSAKYAKKKRSRTVNLKLSGFMLKSIKTKVHTPRRGEVYIPPVSHPLGRITAELLAEIHNKGIGKQPQREFMEITDSAWRKIVKRFYDDELMRILGRR